MPVIQNAVRAAAAEKARAKHHVRLARQNRREQPVVFRRVVFQIRVLDDDDVRRRVRDAGAERRAFALIHLMPDELDARFILRERLELFPSVVGRTIIHDDELLHGSLRQHDANDLGHGGGLVIGRHDRRQARFDVGVGFDFGHGNGSVWRKLAKSGEGFNLKRTNPRPCSDASRAQAGFADRSR